jgi:hypothetical protein
MSITARGTRPRPPRSRPARSRTPTETYWKAMAMRAARALALEQSEFTVDTINDRLAAMGVPRCTNAALMAGIVGWMTSRKSGPLAVGGEWRPPETVERRRERHDVLRVYHSLVPGCAETDLPPLPAFAQDARPPASLFDILETETPETSHAAT